MRTWRAGLGVILAGLLGWCVTAEAGYRGPFEGRVIDAETRQPIQGAVVFVEWLSGTPTPAGRIDEFYDATEVLTDEQGYFRIEKKGSWNPWTNWMLKATGLIYKAGYGAVTNLGAPSAIRRRAEIQKSRSSEERRKMGPNWFHDIEFENGLPVFLLKRLTTAEDRRKNLGIAPIFAPPEAMRRLIEEQNREARALGMENAILPVPALQE